MTKPERLPGQKTPDLNTLLSLVKLNLYEGHKDYGEERWFWNVLVPPDWPVLSAHRPREEGSSGRMWYDGRAKSEEEARLAACRMLGLILGHWISEWMGQREIVETVRPMKELGK